MIKCASVDIMNPTTLLEEKMTQLLTWIECKKELNVKKSECKEFIERLSTKSVQAN